MDGCSSRRRSVVHIRQISTSLAKRLKTRADLVTPPAPRPIQECFSRRGPTELLFRDKSLNSAERPFRRQLAPIATNQALARTDSHQSGTRTQHRRPIKFHRAPITTNRIAPAHDPLATIGHVIIRLPPCPPIIGSSANHINQSQTRPRVAARSALLMIFGV